jgi:hypothetical protein
METCNPNNRIATDELIYVKARLRYLACRIEENLLVVSICLGMTRHVPIPLLLLNWRANTFRLMMLGRIDLGQNTTCLRETDITSMVLIWAIILLSTACVYPLAC